MSTPALLFPAISLLMLAFTTRFLACAGVVRSLHDAYRKEPIRRCCSRCATCATGFT